MTEQQNGKNYLKCPHCACLFFWQSDLQKHMATYGSAKAEHDYAYKKTHGRLEHGYGSDE